MSLKNALLYTFVLVGFGAGVIFTLHWGSGLESNHVIPATNVELSPATQKQEKRDRREPLSILLVQLIVIIITAKVVGALFHRIAQPAVIGEMAAGILLGPSLLGWLLPDASAYIFPEKSLVSLSLLSQVGVILFMFVVGIDLDTERLRKLAQSVILVSHVSIVVPFFLGTLLSLFIYYHESSTLGHIPFIPFALFIGVSMSVTAFPVLARIIEERGLAKSYLGNTAIACAAVDDVTAWCLLAGVVAFVKATGALATSAVTIGVALLFVVLMLFVIRPLLRRSLLSRPPPHRFSPSPGLMAVILVFVFTSALATEAIGIHALFGAFLAGVVMPPSAELRRSLKEGLESFSSVFLLPLFFAFTGLRTEVGLINDGFGWLLCAVIVAVAIAGKLGGSALAARWTGLTWHDSLALGVLMNTRGLVELIVLNAGYDLGILPPRIFAMMVLMAIITTFMTGPLIWLLGRRGGLPACAK